MRDHRLGISAPAARDWLRLSSGKRAWDSTDERGEIVFIAEQEPDGGYIAYGLGHAIFTQAESAAALRQRVRAAVPCHFEDFDQVRPTRIRLLYLMGEEEIAT